MNAAIYIRKSREDKTKPSHRLTVQRQQLPEHARAQGWTPIVYDDGHASAARGKAEHLPERNRLEADIRAGKINIILTIELSRLSRDESMQDYTAWLHLCGEHQVKLATLSRILDPSQHSDWMLLLMEGGFSSVEMKVLQARMEEGRRAAISAGKYISGNPPMPYLYDKGAGGLVIDPDQLEKFRTIMRMAETRSARSTAEEARVPLITVRRMIADDRLLFYQGKRLDSATGEIITGQWPAVIDADQANRIAANRRAGHRSPRRTITGMLSAMGLATCSYCGRAVRSWGNSRTRNDGTRIIYYGCRHLDKKGGCGSARMIPQSIIDELVLTNVANTLERLDQIKTYWLDNNPGAGIPGQLAAIEREITTLQQQKQRLISAITEGIISFGDAKTKRIEIDNAINACTRRSNELGSQIIEQPNWNDLVITREEIDQLTLEEKRDLLEAVLSNIAIGSATMTLTYRFPRSADGTRTARINLPKSGTGNRHKTHWNPK